MKIQIDSAKLFGFANDLRTFLSSFGSSLNDAGRKELCTIIENISQTNSIAARTATLDEVDAVVEAKVEVSRQLVLSTLRHLSDKNPTVVDPAMIVRGLTAGLKEALGAGPNPLLCNPFRAAVMASVRAYAADGGIQYELVERSGVLPVVAYIRENLGDIYAAESIEQEINAEGN